MLYKHVYVGCRTEQYSTLTRVHTHLNLQKIARTQTRSNKNGVLPYPLQVFFCGYPLRLYPISIPS